MKQPMSCLFFAVLFFSILAGCKEGDPALEQAGQNLNKRVEIRYAHVAIVDTVRSVWNQSSIVIDPHEQRGFWAVFNLCSLDVQGEALPRFDYNAGNFYVVDDNGVQYGAMNPGEVDSTVPTGFMKPISALDGQIVKLVSDELRLSPSTTQFPRQFYPSLNYRVAVFINDWPRRYQGVPMTLKYSGHPVLMTNVSPRNPDGVQFVGINGQNSDAIRRSCE